MSLGVLFVTAFIVGLSGAMMPGPLLAVAISQAGSRGFRAGPLAVLGHGLLELALVVSIVYGLSGVLRSEVVSGSIGVAGGAVLAWMGYGMVKSAFLGHVSFESPEGRSWAAGPVGSGVLASISNPYWILWWSTIGIAYLSLAGKYGSVGSAVFFSGHILSDLIWYSLVSLAVVTGKQYVGPWAYRGLLGACGLFLIALSLFIVASGLKTLT